MSSTRAFSVPAELSGSRLDRCIAELHERLTRSRARRLIDDGRVSLNGSPAKPAAVVEVGDTIVVDEPPPSPIDVPPENIPLDVCYEDQDILVLDKPPGLVIHPAAGHPSGTLVNALLAHCERLSGIGGAERPGIVHRLDKDTTGVIVAAKNDRAHLGLSLAFRRRQVEKTYLAVCFGIPAPSDGVIEGCVGRHPVHRRQMAVVPSGRAARTLYTVLETLVGTAVLHCRPITGRTHQIRVHMAHIGHPLVGDPLYAGRQWRNLVEPEHRAACRDFPRQALHARRLAFVHPVSGERVEFEADPPADFLELVGALRADRVIGDQ